MTSAAEPLTVSPSHTTISMTLTCVALDRRATAKVGDAGASRAVHDRTVVGHACGVDRSTDDRKRSARGDRARAGYVQRSAVDIHGGSTVAPDPERPGDIRGRVGVDIDHAHTTGSRVAAADI